MGSGGNRNSETIKKSETASSISLTNATIAVRLEDLVGVIAITTAKLVPGGNIGCIQNAATSCSLDVLTNLLKGDNGPQSSSSGSDTPIESDLGGTNTDGLNVGAEKLRSFMSENEQLKTTLDKVNDTMEKCHNVMSIMKSDMETLRKENELLKNEVNAKIDQVQQSDEMRQKDRAEIDRMREIMAKDCLVKQSSSDFISETKEERIEHQRLLKEFEEKMSLMMTENCQLKEMQKQNLEDISVLKCKQTATVEFVDLSETEIEEIKKVNVDQQETLKKNKAAMEQISMTVKLLRRKELQQQLLQISTIKGDPFCSKATLSYTVQNIDQLKSEHWSPPFYLRKLRWQIELVPIESHLSVYLYRQNGDISTTDSCSAVYEFRLKCHKVDGKCVVFGPDHHLFKDGKVCGNHEFILLKDLLDQDNGYVKNNSITIEVNIKADAL